MAHPTYVPGARSLGLRSSQILYNHRLPGAGNEHSSVFFCVRGRCVLRQKKNPKDISLEIVMGFSSGLRVTALST